MAYSVKNVALGSGLAITAWSHIIPASSALKLIPVPKAWIAFSRVMFLPSRGRKPWFARVFIIGQGPRTRYAVSVYHRRRRHFSPPVLTVIGPACSPFSFWEIASPVLRQG